MNTISPISIIIPAFNEVRSIEQTLVDLDNFVTKQRLRAEIIVVNDGSNDGTAEVLKKLPFITLLNHRSNRGYSTALKTGISNAKYDWIMTFDSDGSHLANQISLLLPFMVDYDLIVGSRDGQLSYDAFFRKFGRVIISRFARYISRANIPDINSGFRLFRKELATKFWHLFPEGFSFSTTLTVAAHVQHYAVKYVPI